MNVYVARQDAVKLRAVSEAFAQWHRGVEVNVGAVDPPSGLPEQPLGDDVARGAIPRVQAGMTPSDVDFRVGIEAGFLQMLGSECWLALQFCAIADREGRIRLGTGPGYELLEALRAAALAGTPLRRRNGMDEPGDPRCCSPSRGRPDRSARQHTRRRPDGARIMLQSYNLSY